MYKETISYYFKNTTQQNLMENVYYSPSRFPPEGKTNEYQMTWYSIISDTCLACPSLLMAQQIISSQMTNNVFVFEFGGPTTKTGTNYAPHASELPFVFDWEQYNVDGLPWSQSLSNSMISAWSNFGIDGHPNVTNTIDKINIIWTPFDDMMVWNDTGKIISSKTYQNGACEFLNYNKGFDTATICRDNPK
eukprot:UN10808